MAKAQHEAPARRLVVGLPGDSRQAKNRPRAPITESERPSLRLVSILQKPPAALSFPRGDRHINATAAGADPAR
jgi:hypothetical protein